MCMRACVHVRGRVRCACGYAYFNLFYLTNDGRGATPSNLPRTPYIQGTESEMAVTVPSPSLPPPFCCIPSHVFAADNCCSLCGPRTGSPKWYAAFSPQPNDVQTFVHVLNMQLSNVALAHADPFVVVDQTQLEARSVSAVSAVSVDAPWNLSGDAGADIDKQPSNRQLGPQQPNQQQQQHRALSLSLHRIDEANEEEEYYGNHNIVKNTAADIITAATSTNIHDDFDDGGYGNRSSFTPLIMDDMPLWTPTAASAMKRPRADRVLRLTPVPSDELPLLTLTPITASSASSASKQPPTTGSRIPLSSRRIRKVSSTPANQGAYKTRLSSPRLGLMLSTPSPSAAEAYRALFCRAKIKMQHFQAMTPRVARPTGARANSAGISPYTPGAQKVCNRCGKSGVLGFCSSCGANMHFKIRDLSAF